MFIPRFAPATPAFALREISLCVALALPVVAQAQAATESRSLPAVRIEAAEPRETTEGTGSYTTGRTATATPLSLSPRDTPQSVSVMTRERIKDEGLQTITDVLNSATGVFVNQYETHRAQFAARGYNINTLLMDGVPYTWDQPWSSGEILTSMAMYDRVEIVRGATGLTTGTGDPSAAVNLVRKRASSKEFTGLAELGIGRWNERHALVDLSTPLNADKTVRARVVGEHSQRDSWTDLRSDKSQTLFATMEADLSSQTLLTAGLSHQKTKPRGPMWGGLPLWYSDGTRTNWDRSQTTSADWARWESTYQTFFTRLEHRLDNDWTLKLSYTRSQREADSYLLYLMGAPDAATGLGMLTYPGSYLVETTQDNAAVQAQGPFELMGRRHELALGYSYERMKFDANGRSATPGMEPAPSLHGWTGAYPEPTWSAPAYFSHSRTTQQAVYGAARFNVTDPLKVILGARLTNYRKDGGEAQGAPYQLRERQELTPYAGVLYDLNDNFTLYASYTDIFRPQQVRDVQGRYLDPVKGKSLETGVKGEFLDGRLNASAAVFQIKQKNLAQATSDTITGPGGLPETAYRAVEGATSKGFELELNGELARGWNVGAGYTQFKLTDADGSDVNTIYPRKLLRLFTSYRLPGAASALTIGGGVSWQSRTYTDAVNPLGETQRIEQKPFALVHLMARYDFTPQLSAQLNVNNVFDKTHYGMFSAYDQLTYAAPRSATLTVKYKF